MASFTDFLKTVAPTVASALGGPLAGAAVTAIGGILGLDAPTQDKISDAITRGQLTGEQIEKLRALELQYQNEEKERGFRYAELEFKDRDSARQANVQGGTQKNLFWLSLVLIILCLGAEIAVLFLGYPHQVPEIVVGRVLGLLDSVAMLVLSYWYGSSHGSALKTDLLSVPAAGK
jgi:hypothetical protein